MTINRGSEWNRWDLHVHTASSYDYKYKGADADDLLCTALRENGIRAVAITDHFTIDKERITSLRTKAPDIVFFPGVELRTDKGSNNLHLILIFSENYDLEVLSNDFDAIMIRGSAKASTSNETIFWSFDNILEFAKKHDALISIHAGNKTNGIDKEISNALPVNQAIKADIAENIHFFEIGKHRDIDAYEQHVFREVPEKPLLLCSDNHDPREYSPKDALWIKADLTFEGLKQCLYQPQERVFIGVIPPVLDRLNKNKQVNIDWISVKRIDDPVNEHVHWFDADIPLNPGMTAIIGNKGSGKSALADIIGHLCKCNTMKSASFLNTNRFKKEPKNYSNDYIGRLCWADGVTVEMSLSEDGSATTIEDAQYLPQKYIEDTCNNIDDGFQDEINKVIFSYVDRVERGEAQDLQELVKQKAKPIELNIQADIDRIKKLNSSIIKMEQKMTVSYKKEISDSLKKAQETLSRHDTSKPKEVEKPDTQEDNAEYLIALQSLNVKIEENQKRKEAVISTISKLNALIDDATVIIAQLELLENQVDLAEEMIKAFVEKYELSQTEASISLSTPKEYINTIKNHAAEEKTKKQDEISNSEHGLTVAINELEEQKRTLIASANSDEKKYQKYLSDLEEWNRRRMEIVGDKDTEGTLTYFEEEKKYLEESLASDYQDSISQRDDLTRKLHNDKSSALSVYQSIYAPIQGEITELLGDIDDNVTFKAELFMHDSELPNNILQYINQKMKGKFHGSKDAYQIVEKLVHRTDFNDSESVLAFIQNITVAATEDLEKAEKKISNLQDFYDYLYSLDYIDVDFKLKMGERDLNELSPGERGIVLLIFYLALSKESKPIIIDQPEDNLDNQSVYSKLVPCICRAKQKRQVIIVTHNPNIAVACDAEQIVFCKMDKNSYQIRYEAGSIENPEIRKHVIDVLEGTEPAFDLRRRKYHC